MSSSVVQNPPASTESKSAKKKKAKAERTESPAPSASPAPEKPISVCDADGSDDSFESPYIRELQKNIRNVNKKIANASKTDPIVEQHQGKTLDELVEARIINADQRAQRLKRPQLEAQLAQFEEQLAQYKKVDEDYRSRSLADKAALEKTLTDKFEKEKADVVRELTEKAADDTKHSLHDSLLALSQFLRLAAARRSDPEADAGLDENMALEGVLLNVKAAAAAYVAPFVAIQAEAETTETTAEPVTAVESDLTVVHAGLTEIDTTGATETLTNGHTGSEAASGAPTNADVSDSAANAAAGSGWDANGAMAASINQEGWVEVPRDPAETETGLTATPAAAGNVQSWADDQPENPPESNATGPAVMTVKVIGEGGDGETIAATVAATKAEVDVVAGEVGETTRRGVDRDPRSLREFIAA
ncbi:hypothetical protein ONZ43_g4191 [Nemania bipapillata]|uniref:Uncharacterized protein n=1 Tax=Nemania bipapillata TaxID=110536 RepID=A0ACC2IQV6_9PEZI|nr:hypothetical protein ONZ43_g4191 [Nemania bipapillata]